MTLPSDKQAAALRKLVADGGPVMPAALGHALWAADPVARARRPHGLRAQGAGRQGGTMGTRLVALGWATHRTTIYRGQHWPAGYAVTREGKAALAAYDRALAAVHQ